MRSLCWFAVSAVSVGVGAGQPLCSINTFAASRPAVDAFDEIRKAVRFKEGVYHLYVSSDELVKRAGGAASIECPGGKGLQRWIIYDPELIKGEIELHFALAHELAHHLNNDSMSGEPRNKEQEIAADRYAAAYLSSPPLNWTEDKLHQALALLGLPKEARGTHPSLQERRAALTEGYRSSHHTSTPEARLKEGGWSGFPSDQTLDFGPNNWCRWRLQITDPAIRLNVNAQGQINQAELSYTYNERWINQKALESRGVTCTSGVPIDSPNKLSLASIRASGGNVRIGFSGNGTTKPGAAAVFEGSIDVRASKISGNLKISRNDLTSAEEAWIWSINIPVSIRPDDPIR